MVTVVIIANDASARNDGCSTIGHEGNRQTQALPQTSRPYPGELFVPQRV